MRSCKIHCNSFWLKEAYRLIGAVGYFCDCTFVVLYGIISIWCTSSKFQFSLLQLDVVILCWMFDLKNSWFLWEGQQRKIVRLLWVTTKNCCSRHFGFRLKMDLTYLLSQKGLFPQTREGRLNDNLCKNAYYPKKHALI